MPVSSGSEEEKLLEHAATWDMGPVVSCILGPVSADEKRKRASCWVEGGLKVLDAPVLFLNQCAEFRMARRTASCCLRGG